MIRRPPRSTQSRSSAASDVYKRQRLTSAALPRSGHKSSFPTNMTDQALVIKTLSTFVKKKCRKNSQVFSVSLAKSSLNRFGHSQDRLGSAGGVLVESSLTRFSHRCHMAMAPLKFLWSRRRRHLVGPRHYIQLPKQFGTILRAVLSTPTHKCIKGRVPR